MNKFTNAMNLLYEQQYMSDIEQKYMSDMNNYLAVHATAYLPKVNKNGKKYIPSTAMSQNFEHTRSTVHITLNHIVNGHAYGDWSEMPYVIMSPFNDLMKENGTPAEMSAVDTYFSVHPDKGLILPSNYHIVMPADDIPAGKLYEIRGNITAYKHENFTDAEEQQLKKQMSHINAETYEKYKTGELADYEIESELYSIGETGKKLYDGAKDKKAFLRGLLENKRNAMLASEVRNMAMKNTAENMGFNIIQNVYDGSDPLQAVAKTATLHNISGNSSNKGHSNSMYSTMETVTTDINMILYGNCFFKNKGILNYTDDIKKLGQELITTDMPKKNIFIQSLINNAPLNLYNLFTEIFNRTKELFCCYDKKYKSYKTIADWDSNTAETIRRYCDKQEKNFEQWRQKASKSAEYKDFINLLRIQQTKNISTNSYEY